MWRRLPRPERLSLSELIFIGCLPPFGRVQASHGASSTRTSLPRMRCLQPERPSNHACPSLLDTAKRPSAVPRGPSRPPAPGCPIPPSPHAARGRRQAAAKGCRPDAGFIICRASASSCGPNAIIARRRRQRQSFARRRPAATRKSRPMLDAMRRGAVNWLAKILLGLLIIAFAVWGVADVFRGYGRGTLARIGSTEISVEEYRQAYQDEMASISRRMGGRRLTTEQAKLLGIEQRALSRLIGAAAIDTHARQLHLAPLRPGHRRARSARTPPSRASDGAFSQRIFQSYLRQNGISEGHYVATRRKEEVREQLTDTLLGGLSPPQLLIDLLHRYQRGDARHRVLHPRLRQARQARRARRGQAQGVLRAEQAPVHDARAAQDQRAPADARGGQGARWRSARRRSRPPTSRTRRSSTSPRSARVHAALLPRQGGRREGLRRARQGQGLQGGGRPSWASRRAISSSACSRART